MNCNQYFNVLSVDLFITFYNRFSTFILGSNFFLVHTVQIWNAALKQKLHFLLFKCAATLSWCRNKFSECKMVFNKTKLI